MSTCHPSHPPCQAWADEAATPPGSSPSFTTPSLARSGSARRLSPPPLIVVPTLSPPPPLESSPNETPYGTPPPSPHLPPVSPALSSISNLTLSRSPRRELADTQLRPSDSTTASSLLARRRGALSLPPLLTLDALPSGPPSALLSPLPSPSPAMQPPTSAGFTPPVSPRFVNPFDARAQRSRQVDTIMRGVRLAPAARTVDISMAGAGQTRARAQSVGAEFGDAGLLMPGTAEGGGWSTGSAGRPMSGVLPTPPESVASARRTAT